MMAAVSAKKVIQPERSYNNDVQNGRPKKIRAKKTLPKSFKKHAGYLCTVHIKRRLKYGKTLKVEKALLRKNLPSGTKSIGTGFKIYPKTIPLYILIRIKEEPPFSDW